MLGILPVIFVVTLIAMAAQLIWVFCRDYPGVAVAVVCFFPVSWLAVNRVRDVMFEREVRRAKNMPSAAELNYRFHKRIGNIR